MGHDYGISPGLFNEKTFWKCLQKTIVELQGNPHPISHFQELPVQDSNFVADQLVFFGVSLIFLLNSNPKQKLLFFFVCFD